MLPNAKPYLFLLVIASGDLKFVLDYVSTHTRTQKVENAIQHKEDELLQCRLCNMTFDLNTELSAHFNFHRKLSILLSKESGIEDIDNDDKLEGTKDEIVSTGLVQL